MNDITTISNDLPEEFKDIASVLQLDAQLLGDYSVKAVNGRRLQEVLDSTRDHTTWAKQQITRLNLMQGEDYEILSILGSPYRGSREISQKKHIPQNLVQTYCFTMDAAKTVAMVSEAQNGTKVRKYFLHMEKVAQEAHRGVLPSGVTEDREERPPLPHNATIEQIALDEFDFKVSRISRAVNLGWGKGYLQKMIGQAALDTDASHHTHISRLIPAPTALPGQKEEIDLAKGEHLLRQVVGSKELSLDKFKDMFKLKTTTPLNETLVALGYQRVLRAPGKKSVSGCQLMPGKDLYATQVEMSSGPFKGQYKITTWILNSFSDAEKSKIAQYLKTQYPVTAFK